MEDNTILIHVFLKIPFVSAINIRMRQIMLGVAFLVPLFSRAVCSPDNHKSTHPAGQSLLELRDSYLSNIWWWRECMVSMCWNEEQRMDGLECKACVLYLSSHKPAFKSFLESAAMCVQISHFIDFCLAMLFEIQQWHQCLAPGVRLNLIETEIP